MIDHPCLDILIVEDNLADARLLQEMLYGEYYNFYQWYHVKRLQEALHILTEKNFDIILLDLTLPDSYGLDSLIPLQERFPNVPIVILTNTDDDYLAIEAVKRGAQDYLVKRRISAELLVRSLRYAIERKRILQGLSTLNKALENRVLEQTAELVKVVELSQLKSDFVSMISHDFRNPLSLILMSTELLRNNSQRLPEGKKDRQFELIHAAINNMARLLDEVSLLTKADAGKLQLQLAPLDLPAFCQQIIDELQYMQGTKHHILLCTNSNIPLGFWDEGLLRHILTNLITNAIKYTPEGGRIKLILECKGKEMFFHIEDEGIGIPEADQKSLFHPFNRASNVGKIPGTGLGLAIVKRCVEVCGGQICFKSQLGKGTCFTITLPMG